MEILRKNYCQDVIFLMYFQLIRKTYLNKVPQGSIKGPAKKAYLTFFFFYFNTSRIKELDEFIDNPIWGEPSKAKKND